MNANYVVMRLSDGLGNQLFQYALGRRLAFERGAQLFLDAYWYDPAHCPRSDRPLALRQFNIKGEITSDNRWSKIWLRPTLAGRLSWRLEQNFLPRRWRDFVRETPEEIRLLARTFDPEVLRVRRNPYLFGYWLSHRYFEGIEHVLRDDLTLKEEALRSVKPYLDNIQNSESVSIHIRRGDFLKHPDFGILDQGYYIKALQIIRQKVKDASFFVFSDDLAEAKQVLEGLGHFQYVDLGPGVSPACDLYLMASCKHHINANSTFSWWGAWLSRNPASVVIVPDKWFVGAGVEVKDIYPPQWIKLPVNSCASVDA